MGDILSPRQILAAGLIITGGVVDSFYQSLPGPGRGGRVYVYKYVCACVSRRYHQHHLWLGIDDGLVLLLLAFERRISGHRGASVCKAAYQLVLGKAARNMVLLST